MTVVTAAKKRNTRSWRVRDVARWIGLAAAPSYALMAWVAAASAPRIALCAPASDIPPLDGMTWMYLLMSFFHVSPWLKLATGRLRQPNYATPQN